MIVEDLNETFVIDYAGMNTGFGVVVPYNPILFAVHVLSELFHNDSSRCKRACSLASRRCVCSPYLRSGPCCDLEEIMMHTVRIVSVFMVGVVFTELG